MRHRWLIVALVTLLSCGTCFAPRLAIAADVERTVMFRDGTVLRLKLPDVQIPWRRVAIDGQVTDEALPLSRVGQLTFVTTPATEQVATVRRMIADLGAPIYRRRVEAQIKLIERGAKFRTILEISQKQIEDFEARWRLKEVLDALDAQGGGAESIKADYDELIPLGADAPVEGDVGDWSLRTAYRGGEVVLDRHTLRAIQAAPLEFSATAEPPVVIANRIEQDKDELFPRDPVRIDFQRGPRGESFAKGDDIRNTFVPLGCTFASSQPGSTITIDVYNVGGRSGGNCAANREPRFQGTMTIRFCLPGNERAPAGVRYVGLWISHVAVEGTALLAFDVRNRQIAEIKTNTDHRDFSGTDNEHPHRLHQDRAR